MRRTFPVFAALFLAYAPVVRAVDPIPESDQAARAMKIIDAWDGSRPKTPPKKLHIVYFTPADRDPVPKYAERLDAILEDIRAFYGDEMNRRGFGRKTFPLDRDADGRLIIYLVKGKEPASGYPRTRKDRTSGDQVNGGKVTDECRPALKAAGIPLATETIIIFCNLADWDETTHTYNHHSPFAGTWTRLGGLCWAVDSPIHDLACLTNKAPIIHDEVMMQNFGDVPLGKRNSMFIGSFAHELGHAFSLQHCGERQDEQSLGKSLMGMGNLTYRDERRGEDKGAFLTMASAMKLAGRPLFNGSDKGMLDRPRLQQCEVSLSTNVTRADLAGRHGALRVEGTVKGSPPIYGVAAFFNSVHDAGYRSPTATSVPDAQERFAIEISDLAACEDGKVRVDFFHANNGVSTRSFVFSVTSDGSVKLSQ